MQYSESSQRGFGIGVIFKCNASHGRFGFCFVFDSFFGSVLDSVFDVAFEFGKKTLKGLVSEESIANRFDSCVCVWGTLEC